MSKILRGWSKFRFPDTSRLTFPRLTFLAQYIPSAAETGLGIVDHNAVVDSVKKVKPSRETYAKYSRTVRYKIGKYAGEVGDAAAVRKFGARYPKLNESTVRGFRKQYQLKLKESAKTCQSHVEEINVQMHGRPLMLGNIDKKKFKLFCQPYENAVEELRTLLI